VLGEAELRVLAGDPEVRTHREFETPAERVALDGRHDREVGLAEPAEDALALPRVLDALVRFEAVERVVEVLQHLFVDRVEAARPVEADLGEILGGRVEADGLEVSRCLV
jgi:hypothetical protein